MQLSFHAQHHVNRTKMAKPSPLDLLVSQVSHSAWSHSTDKSNTQVNYVLQLKMGGSGSKSKGFWPFSGSGSGDDQSKDANEQSLARARSFPGATPFVFTRRSSLFFDEDGDLAHEFYEETIVTKNGRKKAKLRRIYKNLTPQGIIKLDLPCIHVDFPVVLCEV